MCCILNKKCRSKDGQNGVLGVFRSWIKLQKLLHDTTRDLPKWHDLWSSHIHALEVIWLVKLLSSISDVRIMQLGSKKGVKSIITVTYTEWLLDSNDIAVEGAYSQAVHCPCHVRVYIQEHTSSSEDFNDFEWLKNIDFVIIPLLLHA